MRTDNQFFKSIALTAFLFAGFTASSIAQDTTTIDNPEAKTPVILTTTPTDGEENVDLSNVFEITFNSEMDESTINGTTLLLHTTSADSMHEMMHEMDHEMDSQMMVDQRDDPRQDRAAIKDSEKKVQGTAGTVKGTISYSDKVAVFTPNEELKEGTQYTFIVTNGVKSSENVALENEYKWSFTTTGTSDSAYSGSQSDNQNVNRSTNRYAMDRDGTVRYGMDRNEYSESFTDTTQKSEMNMIDLGKAGQFVILAKTDIHNQSGSNITGQTGEGSVTDKKNNEKAFTDSVRQSTSNRVAVWQSNKDDTTSSDVSEAIEDMMTAYSNASFQNGVDSASHKNERFQNNVLIPGVHEWSNSLEIESDISLSGDENDVWLFKIGDNLTVHENTVFTLTDGAQADNVFWYVEGVVTIGKDVQFEGIILSMNDITLEKGAKLNGRMFSQSSITLDDNTVTEPRGLSSQTTSTNR